MVIMQPRGYIVLDVGKTRAKLSLWDERGALIAHESRVNAAISSALDVAGITLWLSATLSAFASLADIQAIIPVGHGAAAALVRDGELVCSPRDYEARIPAHIRTAYDALRDPFSATGSPALPQGLNLGAQLFAAQHNDPSIFIKGTQILLWPQYWAWLLSGIAASVVTSLGCHSDLWHPNATRASRLAVAQGWADRLPPLRRADEVLGTITPAWATRTGLPATT